jgi:signal peptidase I
MRLTILLAVLLGLMVVLWVCPLRLAVVTGQSMAPTLKSGQLVLIDRAYDRSQPITSGDVVALTVEDQVIVKRVRSVADYGRPGFASTAPPGTVFVLGDASQISWDSRDFGPVPTDRILGRVIGWFGPPPARTTHMAKATGGDG